MKIDQRVLVLKDKKDRYSAFRFSYNNDTLDELHGECIFKQKREEKFTIINRMIMDQVRLLGMNKEQLAKISKVNPETFNHTSRNDSTSFMIVKNLSCSCYQINKFTQVKLAFILNTRHLKKKQLSLLVRNGLDIDHMVPGQTSEVTFRLSGNFLTREFKSKKYLGVTFHQILIPVTIAD